MVIKSVSRTPPPHLVNVGSENILAAKCQFHARGEVPTLTIRGGGVILLCKMGKNDHICLRNGHKGGQKGLILIINMLFFES